MQTAEIQKDQRSSSCQFFVRDDSIPEGDEKFYVQLKILSGNATIGVGMSLIKILANDDGNGVLGFDMVSYLRRQTSPKNIVCCFTSLE